MYIMRVTPGRAQASKDRGSMQEDSDRKIRWAQEETSGRITGGLLTGRVIPRRYNLVNNLESHPLKNSKRLLVRRDKNLLIAEDKENWEQEFRLKSPGGIWSTLPGRINRPNPILEEEYSSITGARGGKPLNVTARRGPMVRGGRSNPLWKREEYSRNRTWRIPEQGG